MSAIQNDKIYVDVLLSNTLSENNAPIAIQFYDSRSQSILADTTGYYMSIIRFNLFTETLPIWIPSIRSGNVTNYSITMSYNGVVYQQFMNFTSQTNLLITGLSY